MLSGLYEDIYSNECEFKRLIGTKDKKLDKKFRYLKAIILEIPMKVIEGEKYID